MIRDLKGTIEREGAEIGPFVARIEPSKPVPLRTSTAGVHTSSDLLAGIRSAAEQMELFV